MNKTYQITYIDGKVEEIRGTTTVDFTNNWIIFTLSNGMVMRLNNMVVHSIIIYEE